MLEVCEVVQLRCQPGVPMLVLASNSSGIVLGSLQNCASVFPAEADQVAPWVRIQPSHRTALGLDPQTSYLEVLAYLGLEPGCSQAEYDYAYDAQIVS